MYEIERKGIQIPNAYLCEINFNTCIIFTSQSLKIMLQNNFKDSEISCTYIGDDPTPEIEFWFYKTIYIYFKYIINYWFICSFIGCVSVSTCLHAYMCEGVHMPQKLEKVGFLHLPCESPGWNSSQAWWQTRHLYSSIHLTSVTHVHVNKQKFQSWYRPKW